MTETITSTDTGRALATVVGGLLVRRSSDISHARHAIDYARTLRVTGGDGAHIARAQRLANQAIRWVREDNAAIQDVSLCPCGSVYRCTCVAPF